ncbi:Phycobilisome protein [Planctomycetes bacterium Poly30]|uniref:Phycobilisome protein n=1 Tax=Saltatorellus ferox TaxID=2528018 RepID=A0A518EKJ3_9BACT|nr:Phycobilisome protein [Planctomycetes bacterium Poly30]
MNSPILKLVYESENRYLTTEECRSISSYAASIPSRLAIASEVEKVETAAVRDFMDRVQKKYPRVDKFHEQAREKGERDGALTVRVITQSMVLNDMSYLDERLLFWFRTIQSSFGFTPTFIRDSYTFLKQSFLERLSMDAAKALTPYFDRVIEVLSDFPEPATPRV